MITKETAMAFSASWIDAFNSHDLDRILAHYADDIYFQSPFVVLLGFDNTGVITTKEALGRYFEVGLKTYPDLFFELHYCLVGVNSFVVYYTSVNGKRAAERFELNEAGKAVRVECHYTEQ